MHRSNAAAAPAEVSTCPLSTYRTFASTSMPGCRRVSSPAARQCVVARRPSSTPAAASTNAPLQIDASRAPRPAARRMARRIDAGTGRSTFSMPGTMTVSARASDDNRHGTRSATCIDSTSGNSLHTRTSYAVRPLFVLARPNTSHAIDKSPSTTPSKARTATMCGRPPFVRRGANPSIIVILATGQFCHGLYTLPRGGNLHADRTVGCDGLRRTGRRRPRLRCRDVIGGGTDTPHPQGHHPRRGEWGISQRRLGAMGADLPGDRNADRVSGPPFVPVDWCRLAASRRLGRRPPPLGQPDLALHAELRVRMHDFRRRDRALVFGRCAFATEAPACRGASRTRVSDGLIRWALKSRATAPSRARRRYTSLNLGANI